MNTFTLKWLLSLFMVIAFAFNSNAIEKDQVGYIYKSIIPTRDTSGSENTVRALLSIVSNPTACDENIPLINGELIIEIAVDNVAAGGKLLELKILSDLWNQQDLSIILESPDGTAVTVKNASQGYFGGFGYYCNSPMIFSEDGEILLDGYASQNQQADGDYIPASTFDSFATGDTLNGIWKLRLTSQNLINEVLNYTELTFTNTIFDTTLFEAVGVYDIFIPCGDSLQNPINFWFGGLSYGAYTINVRDNSGEPVVVSSQGWANAILQSVNEHVYTYTYQCDSSVMYGERQAEITFTSHTGVGVADEPIVVTINQDSGNDTPIVDFNQTVTTYACEPFVDFSIISNIGYYQVFETSSWINITGGMGYGIADTSYIELSGDNTVNFSLNANPSIESRSSTLYIIYYDLSNNPVFLPFAIVQQGLSNSAQSVTACAEATVNGTVYTTSQIITNTYAGEYCDSIVTTNISIGGGVQFTADMNDGGSSNPSNFTIYNNELYFSADIGTDSFYLFKYNGVYDPINITSFDINNNLENDVKRSLTVYNNSLYFASGYNYSLFTYTDGDANANQFADNFNNVDNLTVYNNILYFSASDPTNGTELWMYDGINIPSMVSDIYPGAGHSYPSGFVVFNNKLYFTADNGVNGEELWMVDASNNVSMVADIYVGSESGYASSKIVYNNKLYFMAFDATGYKFWMYDGTNAPSVASDVSGQNFTTYNNKLYFSGEDLATGGELWVFDGTTSSMVADINVGANSSYPNRLVVFNNNLYFIAQSGGVPPFSSLDFWMYNGIDAPSIADSSISINSQITNFNGKLYFAAYINADGEELCEYSDPCNADVYATQDITACESATINGNAYAISQTIIDTLVGQAENGMDSIITTTLTVNYNTYETQTISACDTFDWIDGNTYTASNNTATYVLANAAGCDSIVTLDLTINNNTGIDVQTACDTFDWIDGNTYTTSNNTATHTLTNAVGCDSVVTLNLTINTVDVSVTNNGTSATANATGATYQWLDCNDGNYPILGETNQTFTASINGSYAVEVTENSCVGVSECVTITTVGIINNNIINQVDIYPNPTKGLVNINFGTLKDVSIKVSDITGRVIFVKENINTSVYQFELDSDSGIYFIEIESNNNKQVFKLKKE